MKLSPKKRFYLYPKSSAVEQKIGPKGQNLIAQVEAKAWDIYKTNPESCKDDIFEFIITGYAVLTGLWTFFYDYPRPPLRFDLGYEMPTLRV